MKIFFTLRSDKNYAILNHFFPKAMALPIATVDETVVADARPIAMPLPDPGTC